MPWNDVPVILAALVADGEIKNDRKQNIYRVAGALAGNAVVQTMLKTAAYVDSVTHKELIAAVSQIQSPAESFKVIGQMCVAGWLIKVKGNRYQITASGLDCLPRAAPAAWVMEPYRSPQRPPMRPGADAFRAAPSLYPEGLKAYGAHT